MIGWRAWYSTIIPTEWVVFSSAKWRWDELPPEGCVGVVEYLDPPYRNLIEGNDWIWLVDDQFQVVKTHAEWGQWAAPPEAVPVGVLKRGEAVTDDDWAAIQAEMLDATEAP